MRSYTDEEREAFRALLKRQRQAAGLTLAELSAGIAELHEGRYATSPQQLSSWETGKHLPADRAVVEVLDALLGCGGELLASLGWSRGSLGTKPLGAKAPATIEYVDERVKLLEGRFDAIEARLDRLIEEVSRASRDSAPDPEPAPPGQQA